MLGLREMVISLGSLVHDSGEKRKKLCAHMLTLLYSNLVELESS